MADGLSEGCFNANEHQHIRYNPLKDEWVLVSPHRTLRPWSGQTEHLSNIQEIPEHEATNPLCPGVMRSSGEITPAYNSTYVFPNDFPALREEGPDPPSDQDEDELFQCKAAKGTCRVMCFHPKSNVYLPTMQIHEIRNIIDEWANQLTDLGRKYVWVQIFENRGTMMGCSNPHPHCQIWASNFLPNEPKKKGERQLLHYQTHKTPLLMDYLAKELARKERLVVETTHWVILVPYWAVWPFETLVLPKQQIQRLTETTDAQREDLAKAMKILVTKYDNLFKCSFPYSMGWHGAPTGSGMEDAPHWTFHGVYLPPLLRSASVKKFIVGYELLAQSQRDLTPERAAQMLREQANEHYTFKG